jgi:hypothetical protein
MQTGPGYAGNRKRRVTLLGEEKKKQQEVRSLERSSHSDQQLF